MIKELRKDVHFILEKDPAARNKLEIHFMLSGFSRYNHASNCAFTVSESFFSTATHAFLV